MLPNQHGGTACHYAGPDTVAPLLGYNKLRAKVNSITLVKINDDPLLVLGEYNKGKVGCFASDCAPHWGSPQFMQWEHYKSFWCNVLQAIKK